LNGRRKGDKKSTPKENRGGGKKTGGKKSRKRLRGQTKQSPLTRNAETMCSRKGEKKTDIGKVRGEQKA